MIVFLTFFHFLPFSCHFLPLAGSLSRKYRQARRRWLGGWRSRQWRLLDRRAGTLPCLSKASESAEAGAIWRARRYWVEGWRSRWWWLPDCRVGLQSRPELERSGELVVVGSGVGDPDGDDNRIAEQVFKVGRSSSDLASSSLLAWRSQRWPKLSPPFLRPNHDFNKKNKKNIKNDYFNKIAKNLDNRMKGSFKSS